MVHAVNIEELYNRQMHEVVAPRTAPALLKGPYTLEQGMYAWKFAPAELPTAPPIAAAGAAGAGAGAGVIATSTKTLLNVGGKVFSTGVSAVTIAASAGASVASSMLGGAGNTSDAEHDSDGDFDSAHSSNESDYEEADDSDAEATAALRTKVGTRSVVKEKKEKKQKKKTKKKTKGGGSKKGGGQ